MMERDKSIDVAKGLLMVFVVIHHIIWISVTLYKYNNDYLSCAKEIQRPLFLCFFMQAFFLITGYCTNFSIDFKTFLKKNIKSLLWVNFIFFLIISVLHGHSILGSCKSFIRYGGLWFLAALFVGKMIVYLFLRLKLNRGLYLIIFLGLSFIGTALNQFDVIPNYWYHRQFLDLSLFLFIGVTFKQWLGNKKIIGIAAIVYVLTLFFCYGLDIRIPHVTRGFYTEINTWPIHILLSASGSVLLINIVKLIPSVWLEYIGKRSLMVYIIHIEILYVVLKCYGDVISRNCLADTLIVFVSVAISDIVVCLIISNLLSKKYTKWMLGKF